MADSTRQHYALATGRGLQGAASGPGTSPKYAKGGAVKSTAAGFGKGVLTGAAKNQPNVPTTTVTKVARKVPGFPVHGMKQAPVTAKSKN